MTLSNLAAILDPAAPDDRPFIIQLSPEGDEQSRLSYGVGRQRIAADLDSGPELPRNDLAEIRERSFDQSRKELRLANLDEQLALIRRDRQPQWLR